MDYTQYLPNNKFDEGTALKAVNLGYNKLKPILPELLTWYQDLNWPVSKIFEHFYINADEDLIPHLIDILNSDDTCWKYNIIQDLLPKLDKNISSFFIAELERIIKLPTSDEIYADLHEIASETLFELQQKI